jgi:hypothetical protein
MRINNRPSKRLHAHTSLLVLVAIPVALLILVLGIQATRANADTTSPGPLHTTAMQQHPLGIPAITPRANLARVSGARFTQDDVVQYIAAHPEIVGAAPNTTAPIVTSVQFITAQQASTLLQGESIGLPDTAPVCVVHVKGSFVFNAAPPGLGNTKTSYTTALLVFDAHTGNLIVSGAA